MIELTNEQTPQERRTLILKELKEQIENIKEIEKKGREDKSNYDENVNPYIKENDKNYREPLSIDKTEEFRILLSWGGGEDGFKLRFRNKELIAGVYYCADWGQYEEIELNEDELSLIFNFYLYGQCPEGEE